MLTVTITMEDEAAKEHGRRSVAIVRISEPEADGCYGIFALERAEPPVRGTPRVAACTVPRAGTETVLSLLARTCGALASAEWAEL